MKKTLGDKLGNVDAKVLFDAFTDTLLVEENKTPQVKVEDEALLNRVVKTHGEIETDNFLRHIG